MKKFLLLFFVFALFSSVIPLDRDNDVGEQFLVKKESINKTDLALQSLDNEIEVLSDLSYQEINAVSEVNYKIVKRKELDFSCINSLDEQRIHVQDKMINNIYTTKPIFDNFSYIHRLNNHCSKITQID